MNTLLPQFEQFRMLVSCRCSGDAPGRRLRFQLIAAVALSSAFAHEMTDHTTSRGGEHAVSVNKGWVCKENSKQTGWIRAEAGACEAELVLSTSIPKPLSSDCAKEFRLATAETILRIKIV